MKKAMFNKFSNFIHHAVETFAPNVAPQEEFVYHWKSVTTYFVDNKDGGVRIEETALPEHLSSMLRIIQEEESNHGEAGTTGACLEYLLQHRLLETLYTLGRTDHPPGMKQIVLTFFTKLLSRISHPLLPHINVHRAVQRLVKACGETKAAPTEKEEIEFLCTVCAKIKSDPYLVNFFIENTRPGDNVPGARPSQRPAHPFSLVDALLALTYSEDARVSVKACEGLMLCASLPEQSAAIALTQKTDFCHSLTNTMCQLYQKLPMDICPDDIELLEAKWGFDNMMDRNDQNTFPGKRQVTSFLSWLDYCDQLISLANPDVGKALASSIHKEFFTAHLLPQLMQLSESGIIVATSYTTRCLRTVCSPALLKEFSYFLLGSDRNVEVIGGGSSHPLTKRLLEHCNHLSEEVCLCTLKLFDTLLQKEEEHVYHSLLLRNVLGRSYLRDSPPPSDLRSIQSLSASETEESSQDTAPKDLVTENKDSSKEVSQTDGNLESGDNDSVIENVNVFDSDGSETSKEVEEKESVQIGESKTDDVNQNSNTNADLGKDNVTDEIKESVQTEGEIDQAAVATEKSGEVKDTCLSEVAASSVIDVKTTEVDESNESTISSSVTSSPTSSSVTTSSSSTSSYPDLSSPKGSRSEVHKVVNSFLSLLPEEAKSSYQTGDSGYDMYLRDAHRQFAVQETICKEWGWPKKVTQFNDYVTDVFFEGAFLHMLMDKLLHLLDQSYSVNLLLTSLISKVALLPHPNLHEYLMDPFLPTKPGVHTLHSVLTKISNEVKHHLNSDPTFSQKLLFARKQLLGVVPTIHRLRSKRPKHDVL